MFVDLLTTRLFQDPGGLLKAGTQRVMVLMSFCYRIKPMKGKAI